MASRNAFAQGLALLLVAALPATAAPVVATSVDEARVLSFRADAVDGVDRLVVQDRKWRIEHVEWQPIEQPKVELLPELKTDEARRLEIRNRRGRARVRVIQQPTAENGFEARILLDDGPFGGAEALSFDVVAVPVRNAPRPRNVLVITIDSLRPDRLGCYGHARPTSPHLDEFSKQCVRYVNAFSTSSFTPPSHASLFTSRYVGDHGLLTWESLGEEQLTLAEVLDDHAYRTGACVNLELLSGNGFGQGIEWGRDQNRDARRVVDDALEFLGEAGADSADPWFLWLHFYDVHRPYGRAPGWTQRFGKETSSEVGNDEGSYNLKPEERAERAFTDADLAWLVDRYDAGIAYTDAQLAPLLAWLDDPERRKDTLVIVTADHGESLLDHEERLFSHDPYLLSAVTRIPLLIRYPDGAGAGTVDDRMTGLIDLAPTVLDQVGIESPPSFFGLPLGPDAAAAGERNLFMECWGWEELKAIRSQRWLLVLDTRTGTTRAFDLAADPAELAPLPSVPAEARSIEKRLEGFAARKHVRSTPSELDPGTLERLRRLGYVR